MGRSGFKILVLLLLIGMILQSIVPVLGAGPSYGPGPDFTISADRVSFQAGSSGTSIVHLASLDGFSGNVTIPFNYVSCAAIGCPKESLSPESVYLAPGGTASCELTFSIAMPKTYDFVLNATGEGIAHQVTVEFIVNPPYQPDFTISTSPGNLTVQAGKSATATIAVSPGCCFIELVNFTATAPNGVTVELSQNSVAGARTVSLTILVSGNLTPGPYSVTVRAAGDIQTHSRTIGINVTALPGSSSPSSSSPASDLIIGSDQTLFYIIMAAIAAVAIVGGLLVVRMRKPPVPTPQASSNTAPVQV